MNAAGIETYIDYLLKQVDETSADKFVLNTLLNTLWFLILCNRGDIRAINARRTWIVDQFGSLIHNGAIPKNDKWIQYILDWFIVQGLFVVKKKVDKSPYRAVSCDIYTRRVAP